MEGQIIMSVTQTEEIETQLIVGAENRRNGLLAAGALAGAFLASACCVVPLLLVTLGISGAWIGNLTALEPYKPYVAAVTLGLIGLGFWQVYFRPKPACEDGSYCARPQSELLTKTALWIGAVITLLAITINWWAPLFY
jgi:mercuric ion transport protein